MQSRPRRVTAADRARWDALGRAACDLTNAGHYALAASIERLVAEVEGALGREAEELVAPLRLLAISLQRAGHLNDAYTVMMRALTLCEEHHGEEGLETCELRTVMGEQISLQNS